MTSRNRLHTLSWLHGVELFEANRVDRAFGRHAHSGFAIGAITEGVGGYWCRGSDHIVPKRTLSLMNPEEPHTGYAVHSGLRYKMLYVSEEAVRCLLDQKALTGFRDINPRDHASHLSRGLTELGQVLNAPQPPPSGAMHVEDLMHRLLGLVFSRHGGQSLRRGGQEPVAVRHVAELIDAHVTRNATDQLTVARMASDVGLTPNYLIQSFSRARGISPHAYLLHRKIFRAKTMIASGMSALETALELGFYDQPHFIRHFRKILGTTPGAMVVHDTPR